MLKSIAPLLLKEWIKLRKWFWIIPIIMCYASINSFLILRAIERRYGAYGMWASLIEKEPPFFRAFLLLVLCGAILGFLQAWPECQGKRLRLFFHLPIMPWKSIAVLIGTGLTLMIAINIVALAMLAGTLAAFHLPPEIVRPILFTVVPWGLLSLATYLSVVAVLAARTLLQKALILLCGIAAFKLLAEPSGYGQFAPSLPAYVLGVVLFLPAVFFVFLRYHGDPAGSRAFPLLRKLSLILAVLSLCSMLPSLLKWVMLPERSSSRIFYSPVHQQFTIAESSRDHGLGPAGKDETYYRLESGRKLSRLEYAQALPTLFAEDLIKWNRFPETIAGQAIDPHAAKYGWQYHGYAPRDWNAAEPMLFTMFESQPKGARLELPTDMFRLSRTTGGIEFLHPEDGSMDQAKSASFNEALRSQGFHFPIAALGGNPDPRKEFDFGFLLVDSQNTLFHLQMVQGRPQCDRGPQVIPGSRVHGIIVAENRRREYVGLVVSDQACLLVMQSDLSLRQLPLTGFHPDTTRFTLWSDMLGHTLVAQRADQEASGQTAIALDRDFATIHTLWRPAPPSVQQTAMRRAHLASILFPVEVVQGEPSSSIERLHLRVAAHPKLAFLTSVSLALLFLLAMALRHHRLRIGDAAIIAIFGPTALLAIALADGEWLRLRRKSA